MPKKNKKRSLFDFLNDIFYKKTPWEEFSDEEKKVFSVYMINRFISMDQNYTELIADLQPYTMGEMTPKMVYELYVNLFPKRKFFVKYIKAKNKGDKKFQNLIELMAQELKWSTKEAEENIELLSKQESSERILSEFLMDRGFSEKEIKQKFKVK